MSRTLRERFEAALIAQFKSLEALSADNSRTDIAHALLAHAKAIIDQHLALRPRFDGPLSELTLSAAPATSAAPAMSAKSGSDKPFEAERTLAILSPVALSPLSLDAPSHPGPLSFSDGWRLPMEQTAALRDFHPEVVLVSPRIPPNTGTVARLCGALCARLHLIEPLGFDVSEKAIRRAGLDYWDEVDVTVHGSLEALRAARPGRRLVLVETGGTVSPSAFRFLPGDLLVFGSETEGLPAALVALAQSGSTGDTRDTRDTGVELITIPMYSPRVRSINLANSVSMVLFAAVEQLRDRELACPR